MQELNSQAQDLVDAGHFDPNAVEETRIVMEERFVCPLFFSETVRNKRRAISSRTFPSDDVTM